MLRSHIEDLELNMAYSLGVEPSDVGSEPVGVGGSCVVGLCPVFYVIDAIVGLLSMMSLLVVLLTVITLPINYYTQRGWHILE